MSDPHENTAPQNGEALHFAAEIVSAYVSNNRVAREDIPGLIHTVHAALDSLGNGAAAGLDLGQKPAVPVKRSVEDDYIVCLEDGKKLKVLKRYLRTRYHLSPEQYRAKWRLPPDYPMVAPSYSTRRSHFAKEIGLGKSGRGGKPTKLKRKRA